MFLVPTRLYRSNWTNPTRVLVTRSLILSLGLGTWITAAGSAAELESYVQARNNIRVDDLQDHLRVLADDALEGREAGSRGGYAAGNYVVQTFQEHLESAGDATQFFQIFGNRYRNVLGILRGSDPRLAHEFILIGAHYDHVGYGSRRNSNGPIGFIHNGADDNASGVAAVLELIEALVQAHPRRSILFALWDGEEKGLLGSKHWVTHPTVPWKQIRLAVNIDMIGRLREQQLEVIGTRSMPGLRRYVAEGNIANELQLSFPWELESNSDHHSFFESQVPVLMFHTGLHDDYHRPSDDLESVNFEGLQSTTRLIFNTITRLADQGELGDYRDMARYEGLKDKRAFELNQKDPAPRLGISWQDVELSSAPGLTIREVRSGSAAERAGLRPSDRLVSLNGHPILASSTLQQTVVSATTILLGVERSGADGPLEFDVTLDGSPRRIGISWSYNAAEPNSVTIVRVIRHSIAHQAGVQVGDRVHRLDGADVRDRQRFRELVEQTELPANVRVERGGRIYELTLPTPPRELTPLGEPTAIDPALGEA